MKTFYEMLPKRPFSKSNFVSQAVLPKSDFNFPFKFSELPICNESSDNYNPELRRAGAWRQAAAGQRQRQLGRATQAPHVDHDDPARDRHLDRQTLASPLPPPIHFLQYHLLDFCLLPITNLL